MLSDCIHNIHMEELQSSTLLSTAIHIPIVWTSGSVDKPKVFFEALNGDLYFTETKQSVTHEESKFKLIIRIP